ncbi:hypothetical protein BJY21_002677 [Kineosphaera limosa]|nr:hypothetical protein [Kineosphaera limosa]NYE01493.1 hypothetical protein [Kineosphaera limosa]
MTDTQEMVDALRARGAESGLRPLQRVLHSWGDGDGVGVLDLHAATV